MGATGYSGGELLKYLLNRSGVRVSHITSESSAGKPVHAVHPHLRNLTDLKFEKRNTKALIADSDVVFSCYPASVGIKPNTDLVKAGVKVIDLSGDFRLPTAGLYQQWYKEAPAPQAFLKKAVYGLPELFRASIKTASLIANPGCYATSAALAAAPLMKPLCVDPKSLIIDAKSGVSGAGKKVSSQYMYSEVDENLQAYSVTRHRHQPEIEVTLDRFAGVKTSLLFTPHLIPMNRGILSVLYATLKKPLSTPALRARYADFYRDEPFVRVLPEGELPQTKNVTHTNFCDLGVIQDSRTRRVLVFSAIDNLVKGAAGQAIQNMNLMFQRPETEGLL